MRLALVLTLTALLPRPASAEVSLQMRDGRVTLVARPAPIQQVLGEWSGAGIAGIGARHEGEETLPALVARWAVRTPDLPAVVCEGRAATSSAGVW